MRLAALAVLLLASPALAAPPACTQSVVVTEPCAGVLVPTERVRALLTCERADLPAAIVERDSARAELASADKRIAALEAEALRPDYATPVLWGLAGTAVGVLVGIFAVKGR